MHGREIAPGTENIGSLFAISAETGKTLWRYDQRAGMMSLVATGGGLIFAGDTNGHFRAFDQDTGKVLWEMNLGSPVTGYPITYCGPRQAIRRREHRQLAGQFRFESPGAGVEAGQRQQRICIRASLRNGQLESSEGGILVTVITSRCVRRVCRPGGRSDPEISRGHRSCVDVAVPDRRTRSNEDGRRSCRLRLRRGHRAPAGAVARTGRRVAV